MGKILITIIVLLYLIPNIYSQSDHVDGFVILNNGDTLIGKIKYKGDLSNAQFCYYKDIKNAQEHSFSPSDIKSYRFIKSGKYYISKKVKSKNQEEKSVFLEYLVKGKLNVYYYRDEKGDHYLVDKDSLELTELPPLEKIVEVNGVQYLKKDFTTNFILTKYLKDCNDIQKEIDNISIDHNPLISLASHYHDKVCSPGEKCIIYERERVPFVMYIFPFTGINWNYFNTTNELYGIELVFWMPRTSERLYFKTGYLYNQPPVKKANYYIYRIPIELEYHLKFGKIEPFVATGINFSILEYADYYDYTHFIPVDFGIDFNVSKRIILNATYNMELNSIVSPFIKNRTAVNNFVCLGFKLKLL